MSKDNGGPAFPFGQTSESSGQLVNGWGDEGMTLRDYFAAKALQGMLSNTSGDFGRGFEQNNLNVARAAYSVADAMLAERDQ